MVEMVKISEQNILEKKKLDQLPRGKSLFSKIAAWEQLLEELQNSNV
jgi:hypothetical protein